MERFQISDYSSAYEYLIYYLENIEFKETTSYLKKLNEKMLKKEIILDDQIITLFDLIKTDFLQQTNGDIEAYTILNNLVINWAASKNGKGIKQLNDPFTFKESLMEANVGNIKKLYEKYKKETHENIQIRFYLILFGIVILHDIVYESGNKYFEEFLEGREGRVGIKRSDILHKYFKIKNIKKGKRGMISDFRFLRNQIAHGKFSTNNKEEIFIYLDSDKNKYNLYKYSEVKDIFNSVIVKWDYLRIIRGLYWFNWNLQRWSGSNKNL